MQVEDLFLTDIDGPAFNVAGCGPKLCMMLDATIAAAYMTHMAT